MVTDLVKIIAFSFDRGRATRKSSITAVREIDSHIGYHIITGVQDQAITIAITRSVKRTLP